MCSEAGLGVLPTEHRDLANRENIATSLQTDEPWHLRSYSPLRAKAIGIYDAKPVPGARCLSNHAVMLKIAHE